MTQYALDQECQKAFASKPSLVPVELERSITQFYQWESRLLANRRYQEWFSLLSKDIRYWMPLRNNKMLRELNGEFGSRDAFAYFDEDWNAMEGRVRKIQMDIGWAENPPSRVRHHVTNIMIVPRDENSCFVSTFALVYRNRGEEVVDLFSCERQDILRRVDTAAGYEIIWRKIILDSGSMFASNISFFI